MFGGFAGVGRRTGRTAWRATRAAGLALLLLLCLAPGAFASATIHVGAREFRANAPDPALSAFTYIVNVDNAKDPFDPVPTNRPGFGGTESNSPVVATGDEGDAAKTLETGRYLISVRSDGHKMWGKHIEVLANGSVVDNDGDRPRRVLTGGNVRVGLRPTPIPEGTIKAFAFHDNAWVNNAPDDAEVGIPGLHVILLDEFHQHVTVDGNGDKLCGGTCTTDADGFVEIPHMHPGGYFIEVLPPEGSGWIQDSTFDGGFPTFFGMEEGSDGTGAPSEQLWLPPGKRTINTFGFVKVRNWANNSGTGSISGTARNELGWPPNEAITLGEPVKEPYVALSSNANDTQVYTAQGKADGTFTIPHVPAGSYTLSIWDEQLDYIIRFINVDVAQGQQVNLDTIDGNGDGAPDNGIGVARWFGWLEGNVYNDLNRNGQRDTGEPAIPNTDVDERWRDGSIKEATMTDAFGRYNYTEAEGGPLGKWFIGEVGFSRFATTGATVQPDRAFATQTPPPAVSFGTDGEGGGLLTNQIINVGHHHEIDWGKRVYGEDETGQIVGIVYHGTTRNEVNARFAGHEDYEPGIPGVTVRLKGLGPDNLPNTDDDTTLNEYTTDHWQNPKDCEVRNQLGALMDPTDPALPFNPLIPQNCLESPLLSGQTKDGAFDGGYAFADMCPLNADGTSTFGDTCLPDSDNHVPLKPGKYITQVLMPNEPGNPNKPLYQITKEEDVNVDNGPEFAPQIPPYPCTGDDHIVPANDLTSGRGRTAGKHRKLCDQRLITLKTKQNANADFYLFTANDIAIPGRAIGLVTNDVAIDNDPQSLWWLNKRPESVPIGIYDRDPSVGGRLIKTTASDENGQFDVMLPSTETFNCPTPAGVCPGMYWFNINDPGTKAHPNSNYNPNLITEGTAWSIWPGDTAQLDTPLIGISAGGGCDIPATTPNLMQVSKPYVTTADTGTARRITIDGMGFGAAAGNVTLGATSLTTGNGGIVSWTDTQIVIQVPTAGGSFAAGQKQLLIHAAGNGPVSPAGITIHVLGGSYTPTVRNVPAPGIGVHVLQNAIDAANPGDLLVLHKGQYEENVIINKRLMLQGSGPGGIITSETTNVADVPVAGTTINGRYWNQNAQAWRTKLAGMSWAGNQNVAEGAGITVVAPSTTGSSPSRFSTGTNARIDGIGLITSQGLGAGGLQVNAHATSLQITNDLIEGNEGDFAGGIALGTPYVSATQNNNRNIRIQYDRVEGNGARTKAGGIGIFNGADNYEVSDSSICSNFSFEYGGGISHYGRSPGGVIARNKVIWNEAANSQGGSGGGMSLSGEIPNGGGLSAGSGSLTVERNLIQDNFAGDDGGAMFLQQTLTDQVDVRNNMIVDNGSADTGAAMLMDDSANVRIVHNTVAENATTGTNEARDGQAHAAGLAVEPNEPGYRPTGFVTLRPAQGSTPAVGYSPPRALFNNIFNENHAYIYSGPQSTQTPPPVAPALTDAGLKDFEIVSWPNARLTPRRSILSTSYAPANSDNQIGAVPNFVTPFPLEFDVTGQATNPQFVSVTIVRPNPPQTLPGDYHINAGSPAINFGLPNLFTPFGTVPIPTNDYDGGPRPFPNGSRPDIGADER